MPYQTVRALRLIKHNNILRVPGQLTGDNAQDFVVNDSQAAALVALAAVTSLGAAPAPTTRTPVDGLVARYVGEAFDGLELDDGTEVVTGQNGSSAPAEVETAVVAGDSRTVGIGTSNVFRDQAFHFWNELALLGQPLNILGFFGTGGSTLQDLYDIQLVAVDELPTRAKWLVMDSGVNDILTGATLAQIKTRHGQITAWAEVRGMKVLDYTTVSAAALNAAQLRILEQFNAWKLDGASGYEHYHCVDAASVAKDPATRAIRAALSDDNLHLNDVGGWEVAYGVTPDLRKIFPPVDISSGMNRDALQLARNPGMLGNNAHGVNGANIGAGCTGTAPNYYQIERTGTVAVASSRIYPPGAPQGVVRLDVTAGASMTEYATIRSFQSGFKPWAASTDTVVGGRIAPTTPNGCHYMALNVGNLAATDTTGTWPTVLGETFESGTVSLQVVEAFEPGDKVRTVYKLRRAASTGYAYLRVLMMFLDGSWGWLGESRGGAAGAAHNISIRDTSYTLCTEWTVMPAGTRMVFPDLQIYQEPGSTAEVEIEWCEIQKWRGDSAVLL